MAKKAANAPKKVKEKKDSYLKDNYVKINEFNGVITEVMHIRNVGSIVRERTPEGGVSSVFVPKVKVKTKKDWKYLIEDKGPKGRKKEEDEIDD